MISLLAATSCIVASRVKTDRSRPSLSYAFEGRFDLRCQKRAGHGLANQDESVVVGQCSAFTSIARKQKTRQTGTQRVRPLDGRRAAYARHREIGDHCIHDFARIQLGRVLQSHWTPPMWRSPRPRVARPPSHEPDHHRQPRGCVPMARWLSARRSRCQGPGARFPWPDATISRPWSLCRGRCRLKDRHPTARRNPSPSPLRGRCPGLLAWW